MNEARFEAVFHEFDECYSGRGTWDVVEWTKTHPNGGRSGHTVWHGESSYDNDFRAKEKAKEMAWILQEEYNLEFFDHFG